MRFWLTLFTISSFTIPGTQAQDAGPTHADWPHYGGTQFSWRYSALDQINTDNVKALTPAWMFQTGDYAENLQTTPIVEAGVMYLITARARVFALDAATGREIWNYRYPEPARSVPGFVGNRGLAIGDGKVFFGTKDNNMLALDQKTGRLIWRVNIDDARQCGCNITAAPLVVKDKVIVGGTGGDGAHRGYITAFFTKNGRLAWRWYVIPGPGEKGNETWKGDSWRFGGGAPWLTGSYDAALDLVYWGTGNAAADFYDADRVPAGADKSKDINLYTASVVALEADTGKLRWHYQEIHDDEWDWDSAYEVLLIDREIRGRMRQTLVHMNKSGITSVLDRVTGELLNVFSVPEVQTWISGITEDGKLVGRKEPQLGKTTTVCPTAAGAKSWNSMAYSPHTGFLYVPVNELCEDLTPTNAPAQEGQSYMNGAFPLKLAPGRTTYSHVDAWDPVTGKLAWKVPYKYLLLASMLATAGDLVFTGNPEGEFYALDARSGNKLWSYQTGAGHRGGSASYSVNGRQYIATSTGWHSSVVGGAVMGLFPDQDWRLGSTLVVFALPEGIAMKLLTASLLLAMSCAAQPVAKRGEDVFAKSCATGYCHGVRGASSGAPRLAGRGFNQAYINNVVTRGIPGTGMASFAATLSRADLVAVVAYVATLNGIANPKIGSDDDDDAAASAGPKLTGEAARGARLFTEAVRSFGRCSTCHEIAGFGISVAQPIAEVPASVAALKALATPNVKTGTIDGESMPVLVLSESKQSTLFYDLTSAPPVERNAQPGAVKFTDGSSWRHSSVIASYNDAELAAILTYLREAIKP